VFLLGCLETISIARIEVGNKSARTGVIRSEGTPENAREQQFQPQQETDQTAQKQNLLGLGPGVQISSIPRRLLDWRRRKWPKPSPMPLMLASVVLPFAWVSCRTLSAATGYRERPSTSGLGFSLPSDFDSRAVAGWSAPPCSLLVGFGKSNVSML